MSEEQAIPRGDEEYQRISQELDDRGYEKKESEDQNWEIWESPDVEVQLFFNSTNNPPRARSKADQRVLVFNDLMM